MKSFTACCMLLIAILLRLLTGGAGSPPAGDSLQVKKITDAPEAAPTRLVAAGSGALVAASEAYVNDKFAPTGTVVFSGITITTGAKGYATIALGSDRRVELGPGSAITLAISPERAHLKAGCGRFRLAVARGQLELTSPGARTIGAGMAEVFDQTIEADINAGTAISVYCRDRLPEASIGAVSDRHGPVRASVTELIRMALVLAKDMTFGGQRFVQMPPQAADPITP